MEIKNDTCDSIIDKYTTHLLNETERLEVSHKIFQYYTLKMKKSATCVFCKKPHTKNEYYSKYNPKTTCRTLRIKCVNTNHPCAGWSFTYGVIYNIHETVLNTMRTSDGIKTNVIVNKNDELYGYVSEDVAQKKHQKLLIELEKNNSSYISQLYDVLIYTENPKLNAEHERLKAELFDTTAMLKQSDGNIASIIRNNNHIRELHKCIQRISTVIKSLKTEQLVHCRSEHITESAKDTSIIHTSEIDPNMSVKSRLTVSRQNKRGKSSNNRVVIPPPPPVASTPLNASQKKIENTLRNVNDILGSSVTLEGATEMMDDLDTYMLFLKKNISKGTVDQQEQYRLVLTQYNALQARNIPSSSSSPSPPPPPMVNPVPLNGPQTKLEKALGAVKDILYIPNVLQNLADNSETKEDLDTYMSFLKKHISKGTVDQQEQYRSILTQYNALPVTDISMTTPQPLPSPQPSPPMAPSVPLNASQTKLANTLRVVNDMLGTSSILEGNTEMMDDLDTYMLFLKKNISKGTVDQQEQYRLVLTQYNALQVPKDVGKYLDAQEL